MMDFSSNQQTPTFAETKALWELQVFEEEVLELQALGEVLAPLRSTHGNGGCELVSAKFIDHPVLNWFVSRNQFKEIGFFERFLKTSIVAERGLVYDSSMKSLEWEWSSPYILDGDIARTLMDGGAYEAYDGSGKYAKELGARFCSALFGDRFEDIQLFKNYQQWSGWFYGVAWDQTWIGVDKRSNRIWALLLTDAD